MPGPARAPTPTATWWPWKTRTAVGGTARPSARRARFWTRRCASAAPAAAATDWAQIARLYGRLNQLVLSPVVALNRAVAVAMADGPAAGLRLVEKLDGSGALSGYYLLPATRADLLRRTGRRGEAEAAYRRALQLAPTDPERRYLARKLAETSAAG